MSESEENTLEEEKKALCTCKRIYPERIEITEEMEALTGHMLRRSLDGDMLQVFALTKHDQPELPIQAMYLPNLHVLLLSIGQEHQWAKDIPSMAQFLRWWLMEPDVWQEHVFDPALGLKP